MLKVQIYVIKNITVPMYHQTGNKKRIVKQYIGINMFPEQNNMLSMIITKYTCLSILRFTSSCSANMSIAYAKLVLNDFLGGVSTSILISNLLMLHK